MTENTGGGGILTLYLPVEESYSTTLAAGFFGGRPLNNDNTQTMTAPKRHARRETAAELRIAKVSHEERARCASQRCRV